MDWRELVIGLAGVLLGAGLGYYYGHPGGYQQIHIGPIEIGRGTGSSYEILGFAVGLACGVEYWALRDSEDYPAILDDCSFRRTADPNPTTHATAMDHLRSKLPQLRSESPKLFKLTKTAFKCVHETKSWSVHPVKSQGLAAGELRCAVVVPDCVYLEELAGSPLSYPFTDDVELTRNYTPPLHSGPPSSKAHQLVRETWV